MWKPDDWMVKAVQEGIGKIPDYWGVDLREDGCVVLTSLVSGCQNSVVPLDDPKCFDKIRILLNREII